MSFISDTHTEVFRYLEQHLGDPVKVSSAKGISVCIASYDDQPFASATTLSTVGLSAHIFKLPDGRFMRNEILLCTYSHFIQSSLYELALDLSDFFIQRNRYIAQGEVWPIKAVLFPGSILDHIFLYSPVYFPEALYSNNGTDPVTAWVWAIPISKAEAFFIQDKGIQAFNKLLEENDPDLCDFMRKSLI